jgi:hypothetical protein
MAVLERELTSAAALHAETVTATSIMFSQVLLSKPGSDGRTI